jgi:hypothetical protein
LKLDRSRLRDRTAGVLEDRFCLAVRADSLLPRGSRDDPKRVPPALLHYRGFDVPVREFMRAFRTRDHPSRHWRRDLTKGYEY